MVDYFVDGEEVLENKLGIVEADELKAREQDIVANQTAEILNDTSARFDLDYLLHVHRVLFSDIYILPVESVLLTLPSQMRVPHLHMLAS